MVTRSSGGGEGGMENHIASWLIPRLLWPTPFPLFGTFHRNPLFNKLFPVAALLENLLGFFFFLRAFRHGSLLYFVWVCCPSAGEKSLMFSSVFFYLLLFLMICWRKRSNNFKEQHLGDFFSPMDFAKLNTNLIIYLIDLQLVPFLLYSSFGN